MRGTDASLMNFSILYCRRSSRHAKRKDNASFSRRARTWELILVQELENSLKLDINAVHVSSSFIYCTHKRNIPTVKVLRFLFHPILVCLLIRPINLLKRFSLVCKQQRRTASFRNASPPPDKRKKNVDQRFYSSSFHLSLLLEFTWSPNIRSPAAPLLFNKYLFNPIITFSLF